MYRNSNTRKFKVLLARAGANPSFCYSSLKKLEMYAKSVALIALEPFASVVGLQVNHSSNSCQKGFLSFVFFPAL